MSNNTDKLFKKTFTVRKQDLANRVGSGTSPVLSSPSLLTFIEETCMASIKSILESSINNKNTCVGVKSDFYHLKPTREGEKVEVISRLIFIEKNRKLHFKVDVYNIKESTENILISTCDHIRYLVPEDFYKIV